MAKQVDSDSARKVIIEAYNHREKINDEIGQKIESILKGAHLTYRYVLVTALLSKATNGEIDPLSLQAQDTVAGAYDARSIAHSVLVPFEREYLPNSLGASNEPYLNKPARYPRLSTNNAVRRGKDRNTLITLIDVLEQITTSDIAMVYLKSALAVMEQISKDVNKKYEIDTVINASEQTQTVLDYISDLTENSCEGETCALIVSTIEKFYNPDEYQIVPHKVNESGSSSKEVGDIDIKDQNGNVVYSIEVKDKDFSKEDVEHAIKKFHEAGLSRSLFVFGKSVNFDKAKVHQVAARFGRIGTFCSVVSILDYTNMRLQTLSNLTVAVFVKEILQQAKIINAKNETIEWLKKCAKSVL